MNKNFVNLHVLISHSPSCLNRDDMNMQKTAVFGGVRRVRVSSQSLKRALRTSDYYRNHLGERSIRTRELGRLRDTFAKALAERFPAELVSRTLELTSGKDGLAENTLGDAVAPWSVAEFSRLCELVQRAEAEGADSKKLEKLVAQEAASLKQAMAQNIDIALSGRMATSGLMTSVDGAMAVAHAITTHAAESDIDWFTAVDDLIADSGEVGAGHLDTQEFSAGVFYRYASVNLRQLQDNLGGASRDRALEVAAHALHLLSTVVPSAKQQSFAAHNLADFAMVSLADQPISLANAFESPVKNQGGFLKPSVAALLGYWDKIHRGYGLDERAAAFDLSDTAGAPDLARKPTLPDVEKWLLADGKA
ncbi:MAG TPA: type I-E CRISPR-associated protein Cas7/Cse4/CasC [Thauera sp.]|jgi:CRISPR system Cascade subunit CasC|nr:type I-E CRISPR-associated protein Cas7/Cse4/CasC [Thauera sp.]